MKFTDALRQSCTDIWAGKHCERCMVCVAASIIDAHDERLRATASARRDDAPASEPNGFGGEKIRLMPGVIVRPGEVKTVELTASDRQQWMEVAAESIVKGLRPNEIESRHRLCVQQVIELLRVGTPRLRIKLPAVMAGGDEETCGFNDGVEDCERALREAGVEVIRDA